MILVPMIELMVYAVVLSSPIVIHRNRNEAEPLISNSNEEIPREISIRDKLAFISCLMIYFIPLALVYFFEYFINQGLVSIKN
jgi:battenin